MTNKFKKGELALWFDGDVHTSSPFQVYELAEDVWYDATHVLVRVGGVNTKLSTKDMHKLPRSVQKAYKDSKAGKS